MRRGFWTVLLVLPLALQACGSTEPADETQPPVVSRDTFVEVYVELRLAARDAEEPEAFEERKLEILDRYGLEPEALTGFVDAHGTDVGFLTAVWDTIEARLDEARREAEAEGDSAG